MAKDSSVKWQVPVKVKGRNVPRGHWEWLSHEGSLTARFHKVFGDDISFQLLNSHWSAAFAEELPLLGLENPEQYWVREIKWSYQEQCWVVARAVIPGNTKSPIFQKLIGLGQESIGKQLFSSPQVTRGSIEVAELTIAHPYYALAKPWVLSNVSSVWARRRTFSHVNDSILVVELFLPNFFQHDLGCEHRV